MEKKGRIIHLEDSQDWQNIIIDLLGDEYEIYSTESRLNAAELIHDLYHYDKGKQFDLAIIDIRITRNDEFGRVIDDETGGFDFISDLINSRVMNGNSVIVLSGNVGVDDYWWKARHRFKVAEVFDKGDFADEEDRFKQIVDETVARVKNGKGFV